ncbi:putative sulfate transporter [Astrocystis sublimbata]|nr:putative sulfate transporter [Astrocystis sublimbata]
MPSSSSSPSPPPGHARLPPSSSEDETQPSTAQPSPPPPPPPPAAAAAASAAAAAHHAPSTPSSLRLSHTLSETGPKHDDNDDSDDKNNDETAPLLPRERAHDGPCDHGTFSPRAITPPPHPEASTHNQPEAASLLGSDGSATLRDAPDAPPARTGWRRTVAGMMTTGSMARANTLAESHGFEMKGYMYLSYYVQGLSWMRQYKLSWLTGDLTAAVSMASMYLPMALSYAENLAHMPPISGLYAFVFMPLIYAFLGTSPHMVVGPEAAGSLLVGAIVKSIDRGHDPHPHDDAITNAQMGGIAVGLAGAYIFVAGVLRFGFLENVLSRPFLRGFISSIGVVIFIDQLIPTLGLSAVARHVPDLSGGSTVDKFQFIVTYLGGWHRLSGIIGIVSFVVVMMFRKIKNRLQPRYPGVAYVPDRLLVVVASALLAYYLDWEHQGVELLGKVEASSGGLFEVRNPFHWDDRSHIIGALGSSFLISMLGFFESSVAAKSLGDARHIEGMEFSANRELVALGVANFAGSFFMSLPAFGGYGRSKLNKSTGGKSPMSSILLSLITVISIFYLLPFFYYIPKPVLSALIMVVAYSLIEELPEDMVFFVRIRGLRELGLMAIIVLVTVLVSLNMGIATGIGLSLVIVVHDASRPRIAIMGKLPNSNNWVNAEDHPERVESVEGVLIVKIPEPLTFLNTGNLKSRLDRMERYGTNRAHPALPRLRPQNSNQNVIFDIHGVTSMDGSGTQVLMEIVKKFREQGVRVFFSRAPARDNEVWDQLKRSGIVALVGGEHLFVNDVKDALNLAQQAHVEVEGAQAEPEV